jgi:type II secretion system protein I
MNGTRQIPKRFDARRGKGDRIIFPATRNGCPHVARRKNGPVPTGFTLLEIILALAILAGALAALGEVMRLADMNASFARDEMEAQILASSVMDELLSGARPLQAASRQGFDFETDPPWVFTVVIEPTVHASILRVGVRVELRDAEPNKEPAHYELYRWMLHPDYVAQLQAEEAELAAPAAAAAASTTSTTTGGTGAAGGTGGAAGGGGG